MLNKKYLIVNADDFGLRSYINNGIVKAVHDGIVRSVSLMPNGEEFENAIELLSACPTISVGVHLTLVGSKPILPISEVSTLLQPNGSFFPDVMTFVKYYLRGKFIISEILNELEAQILLVKKTGITITHLDSHQHIHCLPDLFDQIKSLALKYNIKYIRIPEESFMLHFFFQRPKRVLEQQVLAGLARGNRKKLKDPLFGTDHFRGFLYGGCLTKERIIEILSSLKDGITELMCHPGYQPTTGNVPVFENYAWQTELEALTDPDVANFISAKGIILTDFSAIASMQNVFCAV